MLLCAESELAALKAELCYWEAIQVLQTGASATDPIAAPAATTTDPIAAAPAATTTRAHKRLRHLDNLTEFELTATRQLHDIARPGGGPATISDPYLSKTRPGGIRDKFAEYTSCVMAGLTAARGCTHTHGYCVTSYTRLLRNTSCVCGRLQECPLTLKDLLAGSSDGRALLQEAHTSKVTSQIAQNACALAQVRGHAMTADVIGRLTKGLDMKDATRIFNTNKGPVWAD